MNNSKERFDDSIWEELRQDYLQHVYPGDLADVLDSSNEANPNTISHNHQTLTAKPATHRTGLIAFVVAAIIILGLTVGVAHWSSQPPSPVATPTKTEPKSKGKPRRNSYRSPLLFTLKTTQPVSSTSTAVPALATTVPSLDRSRTRKFRKKSSLRRSSLFPTNLSWTNKKTSRGSPARLSKPLLETKRPSQKFRSSRSKTTTADKKRWLPKNQGSRSRFRFDPLKSIRL